MLLCTTSSGYVVGYNMTGGGFVSFTDPEAYQAAIRPTKMEVLVTTKGNFLAELTRAELPRLRMHIARESLPRVVHSVASNDRPPIFFLTSADQASIRLGGRDLTFGEIVFRGSGTALHHKSEGPCDWSSLLLTQDDLAAAGHAIVGRDLIDRSVTHYLRPPQPLMLRLLKLRQVMGRLERTQPTFSRNPKRRGLWSTRSCTRWSYVSTGIRRKK